MQYTVLLLSLSFILGLGACAVKSDRTTEGAIASAKEQRDYDNAEKNLAVAHYEDSLLLFKEFQNIHPQSKFRQSARLGEAKSLEGLARWNEAVAIYNDIYLKTSKYQRDIAALAMYNLSFSYEALGDDTKAITALLDAKKSGEYLEPEVVWAEIPARLAMLYGKFDRSEEARNYFIEAEIGIKKVIEKKRGSLDQEWLVKTYYQMGSVSTNQLSSDNFAQVVQGQKYVQGYLIKALEYPNSTWGQRSLAQLKETYNNLLSATKSVDAGVSGNLSLQETKNSMGADLFDLINQAELYQPLEGVKLNSLQEDFSKFLRTVQTETEKVLYSTRETMTLTPESDRLNSIKRALPPKKKPSISLPPKTVPSQDPNL